ncbi:GIY-YIG nuclease superfamily [Corchorus capsularis]|uniref:Structure-specific endonuclease subunit SLX1 homolog n=1 Tax=Corchorus capsularis TaxID=210143 RepID=A0A1R3IK82_COCAP|nr:GIY-YIG nuclease superfamily [Corchorus capsularis]
MRKGKTAGNGKGARKRNRKAADSKSLIQYFKQKKSRAAQSVDKEEIRESEDENKGKQENGFFACYLLTSLSPRHKGQTYIGFTVNPRRRIRQHNGEIGSGAWRTKSKRPWEMVICIYGFPKNVSALKFEWAWQHPHESVAVREAAATFKSLSGVANKIKLAYTMLTLPAWQSLDITVNYFSTKYMKHSASCPSLPEHMKVRVCPMDELPCYTEQDEFEYKDECDDIDEYDEVSDTWETYPDEGVNVSADNLQGSIHEASDVQFEHVEEYRSREPVDSSSLGVHDMQPHVFIDSPTSKASSMATGLTMEEATECEDMSIIGRESLKRKKFTDAVEADEDSQPLFSKKVSTSYEGDGKPEDSSTFGVYHKQPFDFIYSPVQTSYSAATSLSNGETVKGANISITEKECPSHKQFAAVVEANEDQQQSEKPLRTEGSHEVEVIDLLTPSPDCRARSYSRKRRISKLSPEIIDLT